MKNTTKLYNHLGLNTDNLPEDLANDYLTENRGRDGQDYLWYFDGATGGAINTTTGEIITDEAELEKLFY